jgi:hypothetical protein
MFFTHSGGFRDNAAALSRVRVSGAASLSSAHQKETAPTKLDESIILQKSAAVNVLVGSSASITTAAGAWSVLVVIVDVIVLLCAARDADDVLL